MTKDHCLADELINNWMNKHMDGKYGASRPGEGPKYAWETVNAKKIIVLIQG